MVLNKIQACKKPLVIRIPIPDKLDVDMRNDQLEPIAGTRIKVLSRQMELLYNLQRRLYSIDIARIAD